MKAKSEWTLLRCVVCGEGFTRSISGTAKDGISHCSACLARCQRAERLVKRRRPSTDELVRTEKHVYRITEDV